ncbi:MAG: hypothetical protein JSR28_10820 [Proteobacteria bacterium]|nr:hypothetical protein [Pseudomonadota bacterium]
MIGVTLRAIVTLPAALLAITAPPACAQTAQSPDDRVAEILDNAHQVLSALPPKRTCAGASDDEIVVCATTDSSRYRVPSTADSDPSSRQALNTGVPAPPKMDRGSCKGQPGCVVGGWAPPPIYYIDMKAIPEAPAGSDADLIAKGEKAAR